MSAPFEFRDAKPNPLDALAAVAVNREAERAVIAALVRKPDGKKILDLGITPELFAMDATREAFNAIRALILDDIQPDAATLRGAICDASLIEVETSLQEHVSSANLPVYVRLLKDCHRERQAQAARARLMKAAAAGAPDHELQAILESIRQIGQGEPGKGRFLDVGELCELPPTENWLMKGYLTLDSLTVLFGDPGCGKSFLAIDIACHVATGTPWRGCPVKPGKVLYIAGEGRNGLSKRFRAWFERHGEQPRNIQICTMPIALTDPAGIAALVAEIQSMPEQPALIVVDTINRNFGPGDENATADMTKAVAGLDAIRNATGAAILAAHHSGHGDKTRGRGSSVLRASVDVEYAVEKFDRTVQIRCTKAKDFDHPAPLAWTLEKQTLPWADEDGTPLDSAVLEASTLASTNASTSRLLTRPIRVALDALGTAISQGDDGESALIGDWKKAALDAGLTQSESRQGKHAAFQRAVDALVDAGKVAVEGNRCRLAERQHVNKPSTNRQHVDVVDAGQGGCQPSTTSTHPYRGVDVLTLTPSPTVGEMIPPPAAAVHPVDNFPPGAAAVHPVDNSLPPGASTDARGLWEVLRNVQGSATAEQLARRLPGWNASGVDIAARELRGLGRASINGPHIAPIHPPAAGAGDNKERF